MTDVVSTRVPLIVSQILAPECIEDILYRTVVPLEEVGDSSDCNKSIELVGIVYR